MSSSPPDLRVLCRRLASTSPDDLPRFCTALMNHVIRCAGPLSAPHDAKAKLKDGSSEVAVLVHRFRTHVSSLLTGRSPGGRFTAVVLIKTVIDVGGWECLRLSEPWVRGLISLLRKPAAPAVKELGAVTLARIYTLLQEYQTLTREIATPTVSSFADACLQLIKPPASGQPLRLPTTLVETVVDALTTLVLLYPSTLRPLSGQMREAVRGFVAPTSSDGAAVPHSLSRASRCLLIALHHTAPKNGSAEEWETAIAGFVRECHATADQVFRAVQEHWESTTGYHPAEPVSPDGEPHGGGKAVDELPPWSGLLAGSERLTGLLGLLGECFSCPTRSPVALPLAAVTDVVSRVSLLAPPGPGQDDRYQANPAIGRDERDQLWSALPDMHVAAMWLLLSVLRTLGRNALPLAADAVDQTVRMFASTTRHIAPARETSFTLARELLLIVGPGLDKAAVDSLNLLIQACCRDLLDASGYAQEPKKDAAAANGTNGARNTRGKTPVGNADAFLKPQSKLASTATLSTISPDHSAAARDLLAVLFSHLPQQHVSPDTRGLMDRTSILSGDKTAMLASCLYPYRDAAGRFYPSILPFLSRQFPGDQEVEVLRSNLRTPGTTHHQAWDPRAGLEALLQEPETAVEASLPASIDPEPEQVTTTTTTTTTTTSTASGIVIPSFFSQTVPAAQTSEAAVAASETAVEDNPFRLQTSAESGALEPPAEPTPYSSLKRKGEELESSVPKKVERADAEAPRPAVTTTAAADGGDDSDSDSGRSIQIDMTLDEDDEEEE